MLSLLFSLAVSQGAMSSELSYISSRMDSILNSMLTNPVYQGLQGVFSMVGVLLMCVYFFVDLLDKVSDMQFDLEVLFKQLLKFVVAFALMTHVNDLCIGLGQFSEAMVDAIEHFTVSPVADGTFSWSEMIQSANAQLMGMSFSNAQIGFTNGGALKDVIMIVSFRLLLQFATWKLSIERALKIGYKSLIAPIACADCVTNGYNSAGIKHLKGIFALYMQTSIIMVAMICIEVICLRTAGAGFWTSIVALFLLWDTIKQSETIAEEIVG